jgi:type VI secretion system secreted protein Hcp
MAFDAFLKIDGVNGESTRAGFEQQIELLSFSWGATNTATIGSSGAGGGSGKATVSSFNCLKSTDAASPTLFQGCCSGRHYATAKVTLRKAGGDSPVDYLVYDFVNVYVDSIQWSGSSGGDDRPTESLGISFGKVTVTYTGQSASGAAASPVVGSWDLTLVAP